MPLPPCHLAGPEVLLFSDLTAGDAPASVGDQLKGCSRASAESVLRALAALHGATWDVKALASVPPLTTRSVAHVFADADRRVGIDGAVRAGIAAHAEMLAPGGPVANTVPAEAFDAIKALAGYTLPLGDVVATRENVLRHADVRLDNMMFGEDRQLAALLDWQAICHGWYMQDVAAFIIDCCNDPACLAKDAEFDLLKVYLEALPPSVMDKPTLDEAKREYALCIPFLLLSDCPCWLEQVCVCVCAYVSLAAVVACFPTLAPSPDLRVMLVPPRPATQTANVKAGNPPFSDARMAKLAPLIASNRAQALLRHKATIDDLLGELEPVAAGAGAGAGAPATK